MADNKRHLGHSPLSGRIYLGRQNNGMWQAGKRDVTSEFLQVMEHKVPINTCQNVTVNGENKYRIIVVDMKAEVTIDGKPLTIEKDDV